MSDLLQEEITHLRERCVYFESHAKEMEAKFLSAQEKLDKFTKQVIDPAADYYKRSQAEIIRLRGILDHHLIAWREGAIDGV